MALRATALTLRFDGRAVIRDFGFDFPERGVVGAEPADRGWARQR